jgi:hypothetical protein
MTSAPKNGTCVGVMKGKRRERWEGGRVEETTEEKGKGGGRRSGPMDWGKEIRARRSGLADQGQRIRDSGSGPEDQGQRIKAPGRIVSTPQPSPW